MTRTPTSKPDRRTVLSALGTGLATSLVGTGATMAQEASQYVLVQNGECVPVQPITGDAPVDEFYEYQLPEGRVSDENGAVAGTTASYASAGTRHLQRAQTSIAFLYRGPEGLSLVVVHGSVDNDDAGSVTFELAGLPADGEWVVKDDLYRDPDTGERASTNYDNWDVAGTDHRIDWTWGSSGTDGGAFRGLGDAVNVTVRPAFNEAAALHGEHYQGTITDWEFLSAGESGVERLSLALDEPIRVATGGCGDVTTAIEAAQQTEQSATASETATETETETETETQTETERNVEQEQNVDVEQEQEIEGGADVETEQEQEVHTEQEQRSGPPDAAEEPGDEEGEEDDDDERGREDGDDEEDDGEEEERGDREEDDEEDDDDEDVEANVGLGLGHRKGRGKGHEKGRGEGHEKHDDD